MQDGGSVPEVQRCATICFGLQQSKAIHAITQEKSCKQVQGRFTQLLGRSQIPSRSILAKDFAEWIADDCSSIGIAFAIDGLWHIHVALTSSCEPCTS